MVSLCQDTPLVEAKEWYQNFIVSNIVVESLEWMALLLWHYNREPCVKAIIVEFQWRVNHTWMKISLVGMSLNIWMCVKESGFKDGKFINDCAIVQKNAA